MIDNFDLIRKQLIFKSSLDRYIIHIIKRGKDKSEEKFDLGKENYPIKTFYINSLENFDKKIQIIKKICENNNARAYILPQVRNIELCFKQLIKITVDNLNNHEVNPESLISSAFCGTHSSRDKRWIVDYDFDNTFEYEFDFIVDLIKENHEKIGRNDPDNDLYVVPTKNGKHIVTRPFDLSTVYKKCDMLYQGVKKRKIGEKYIGPAEQFDIFKNATGFVIKDGMTVLYVP